MAGTLFVVATPIGNLEDITLRALRVLREADIVAAEDTRRTARLLTHHGISTPTLSFHEHNTRARLPQLIARLEAGERVALVTDAGTPGISDPGIELVRACIDRGIPVDPIPGASAPLTAAVASGFPLEPLTVFGFAPSRAKDRKRWLEQSAAVAHTFTFFEAPHRIRETLSEAAGLWGGRPIVVARELTKLHQEFLAGPASSIIGRLTDPRGEFTVVVGPRPKTTGVQAAVSDDEIVAEFGRTTDCVPGGRREAISAVARKYGRSSRDIYTIVERAKKSGK
ncbi:MAG: 16S rRNA (cytidine(1402)-2'-O)-methyltransferase [Acidimicrobiia bacterium]|nr:16S rRNA (cytidine(1402)-2'-O)-methyltransferase [Acidimicrobiia bacterium]